MVDAENPCRIAALRILQFRFNSEAELRRKLRAKKFEPADIDETIAQLRAEKWLDDSRFAEAFARTRALKRVGPERIRRELRAAGVEGDAAARAVRDNADPDRERTDLIALFEKKRRALVRRHGEEYPESREGRQKLLAYLLNQGYSRDAVEAVLKGSVDDDF